MSCWSRSVRAQGRRVVGRGVTHERISRCSKTNDLIRLISSRKGLEFSVLCGHCATNPLVHLPYTHLFSFEVVIFQYDLKWPRPRFGPAQKPFFPIPHKLLIRRAWNSKIIVPTNTRFWEGRLEATAAVQSAPRRIRFSKSARSVRPVAHLPRDKSCYRASP